MAEARQPEEEAVEETATTTPERGPTGVTQIHISGHVGTNSKKGHTSANCRFNENPGHKKEATRKNTMGGSQLNAGFGNAPNGK